MHRPRDPDPNKATVVVVGAGPAGLIAAETIAAAGYRVVIFDQMPSPARKFLMAGRGGLNLTHSFPLETFLEAYDGRPETVSSAVKAFPPDALRAWSHELGIETFVGSSGRVFPKSLKASPLLRAWLMRLQEAGVDLRTRHRWTGMTRDQVHTFETPDGPVSVAASASVLSMGGASWPRLGSDGQWRPPLAELGVPTTDFTASNCGIRVSWSDILRKRFAGAPLKRIAVTADGRTVRGELVITDSGLEGGAIYALSPELRRLLNDQSGVGAEILLDLRPDLTERQVADRLARPFGRASTSTHLRKSVGLHPPHIALLREVGGPVDIGAPEQTARAIKALPVRVSGLAGLDRAISSVGGLSLEAVDHDFMLKTLPGVFAAGEMLDWDAPTGGFLLQACFATGRAAGHGATQWLRQQSVAETGKQPQH